VLSGAQERWSEAQRRTLLRILPDATLTADGLVLGAQAVPRRDGILRFRQDNGYNRAFEMQWKQFQLNQYDRANGTTLYRDRYRAMSGWPLSGLEGELILEAGCGAGAFTCHLLATGADLVSFDYSGAVEVAAQHNASPRAVFAQADLLALPFQDGTFDRVFCHGVLQHTPDPRASFMALHRCLRPAGRMSIDIYAKDGRIATYKAKYLWRWLSTRVEPERLMAFLRWFLPKWLPFDTFIKRIPLLGRFLGAVVPCMNYCYTALSREQQREWSIMNTFDALAPLYDNPRTEAQVRGWFEALGYRDVFVRNLDGFVHGTGIKAGA
jgi:SAM-dependent methyltransferase